MPLTQVPLDRLIADPFVHGRRRDLPQTVLEYLELSRDEAGKLPPVTAFCDPADPRGEYWLADGFLRAYAWHRAGHESVPVEVLAGTRRDAMLYACGANAEHGVRRTRNDKWNAVVAMLQEPEWAAESDGWIAEKCAVSVTFVKQVREDCVTPEAFVEAQLRREGLRKKWARKDAKREARLREIYKDSPDAPTTMTNQQMFDLRIGWAHRTAHAASVAASAASRAYPEAVRLTALTALSDARLMLQDLLPASARAKLPAPSPEEVAEAEQAVQLLAYLGVHVEQTPEQPAANQGREARDEGRVGRKRDTQPATNQDRSGLGPAPLLLAPRPSSLAPPSPPPSSLAPPFQPATNRPDGRLFSPFDDEEGDVMDWHGPAQIETYYPSSWTNQPATNHQGRETRDEGRAESNQPATNRAGSHRAEDPAPAISNLKFQISNPPQPATNHPPEPERPRPPPSR